jgi:protein-disulfide isomerase
MHTITILRTEGCLGAPEAEKLARSLAAARRDVTVEVVLVADEEQAVALGFRGSPTVLVNGEDVEPSPEIPLGTMA